jgi:hypothetical protein
MNYDLQCPVESRYKYRKVFYRATVIRIDDSMEQITSTAYSLASSVTNGMSNGLPKSTTFGVCYDDGEKEFHIERDAIRPTQQYLADWQAKREYLLQQCRILRRRQLYFEEIVKERKRKWTQMTHQLMNVDLSMDNNEHDREGDRTISKRTLNAPNKKVTKNVNSAVSSPEQSSRKVLAHQSPSNDNNNMGTKVENSSSRLPTPKNEHDNGKDVGQAMMTDGNVGLSTRVMRRPSVGLAVMSGRVSVKVSIKICRGALRFNWVMLTSDSQNSRDLGIDENERIHASDIDAYEYKRMTRARERQQELFETFAAQPMITNGDYSGSINDQSILFYNPLTEEQSDISSIPLYSIPQIFLIQKVQLRWRAYHARKRLQQKTLSLSIFDTIENTIKQGSEIAFIGYRLEGLTTLHLFVRAGYFELAEVIREHYQAIHKSLNSLVFEEIMNRSKEGYELLGIVQTHHVRDLKELQTWWKKTLPYEREKKLCLFNSYSSQHDNRCIQDCIQDSADLLLKKFIRYIKANQSKTKQTIQNIVNQSNFPHSHQQIETYLKRYSDKPELARVSGIPVVLLVQLLF